MGSPEVAPLRRPAWFDEEEPMALPKLTEEQRAAALKKAAEARQKRAELRARLKGGEITFMQAMKLAGDPASGVEGDPIIARMKVVTLLESLPGFGKAKATKLMSDLDISQTRRVQGLGARQRAELIERLG